MKRVLFDHNVPAELRNYCKPHYVRTAKEEGWRQLENGKLLAAAEAAGFEVFVTPDQNLQYQQNVAKRCLAVVVLGTNDWETIERNPGPIAAAIDTGVPGKAQMVQPNTASMPNTAFIMMAINPAQPELDDVRNGIKDLCKEFGIVAETIDEDHL